MLYSIEYTSAAERCIDNLPKSLQRRILSRIDALAENPRPQGVKKLRTAENHWRIRVGDYRVVYTIEDDVLLIVIVRIADRKDVYRP